MVILDVVKLTIKINQNSIPYLPGPQTCNFSCIPFYWLSSEPHVHPMIHAFYQTLKVLMLLTVPKVFKC